MKTLNTPTFNQLVQDYFCQYLVNQRNVSNRTLESYRDTFRLLLSYLGRQLRKQPSQLTMSDLGSNNVEGFLNYLEKVRGNSIRTRNNRFAAVRSFLNYTASKDPSSLSVIEQVLAIPMKRFNKSLVGFLSKDQVQAILDSLDCSTWSGRRDRVMFETLYNTGARVSELAKLRTQDISLDGIAAIRIYGKGRKERTIPIWKKTARLINKWIEENKLGDQQPLFPNTTGKFLTRSGIEYRLKRATAAASLCCPSLKNCQVSPHIIRHTTALHLLQSGVDITVIALWLGHESITTTHIYVEADLEMKREALAKLQRPNGKHQVYKPTDKLLDFLEAL